MNNVLELVVNWNGHGQFGEWKGRAILYEDGWFEGTVVDTNSSCQENRLVFGVCLNESRIELLKHTRPDISDPFVFRFFFKEGNWEGPFYVISYFGESRFGEATLEIKNTGDNAENEALITKDIETYKADMEDDFYTNCVNMRDAMIQALKEEMEKRKSKHK